MENKTLYSNLAIVDRSSGKVLFLKRSDTVDLAPRKWCLPGGHMDDDETPEEAALREAYEETGLDFRNKLTPVKLGMYKNSRAIIYYFGIWVGDITKYGVLRLVMDEHQSYMWVTPREAILNLDTMLDLGDQLQAMFSRVQVPVHGDITNYNIS